MMKQHNTKKIFVVIATFCFLTNIYSVFALDMSSEKYKLQIDEINMGAIGEMRDFSNSNQAESSVFKNSLKDFLGSHFPWKPMLVIAAGLLLFILCYHFVVKKPLFSKR
jgi:hypothetical protein